MSARKPKPPRTLAHYSDAAWDEVQHYNETEGAHRKPMVREALYRLVMLPFETETVPDLCRKTGAILDLLENGVDESAMGHAIDRAHEALYEAPEHDTDTAA